MWKQLENIILGEKKYQSINLLFHPFPVKVNQSRDHRALRENPKDRERQIKRCYALNSLTNDYSERLYSGEAS